MFLTGLGCVLLFDAAIVAVWLLVVPARLPSRPLLAALCLAVALHLAVAFRLAFLFAQRGMLQARKGVIYAILTTLLFWATCAGVALVMTIA